jgi:hypothetical protein
MRTLELILSKITESGKSACVIIKDDADKLSFNNGSVAYVSAQLFVGKEKGYSLLVECDAYRTADMMKLTEDGEIEVCKTKDGIVLQTAIFVNVHSIKEK